MFQRGELAVATVTTVATTTTTTATVATVAAIVVGLIATQLVLECERSSGSLEFVSPRRRKRGRLWLAAAVATVARAAASALAAIRRLDQIGQERGVLVNCLELLLLMLLLVVVLVVLLLMMMMVMMLAVVVVSGRRRRQRRQCETGDERAEREVVGDQAEHSLVQIGHVPEESQRPLHFDQVAVEEQLLDVRLARVRLVHDVEHALVELAHVDQEAHELAQLPHRIALLHDGDHRRCCHHRR